MCPLSPDIEKRWTDVFPRIYKVRCHKNRGLHTISLQDWKNINPIIEISIIKCKDDRIGRQWFSNPEIVIEIA